jgi:metal-responsive CopG/Arc/MetJ family transcriptional regulator
MKRKMAEGAKTQSSPLVRASISFPPDLYETLDEIAKQKKVSLAWVVRDAAERYVADEAAGQNRQRQTARSFGKLARRGT